MTISLVLQCSWAIQQHFAKTIQQFSPQIWAYHPQISVVQKNPTAVNIIITAHPYVLLRRVIMLPLPSLSAKPYSHRYAPTKCAVEFCVDITAVFRGFLVGVWGWISSVNAGMLQHAAKPRLWEQFRGIRAGVVRLSRLQTITLTRNSSIANKPHDELMQYAIEWLTP